METGSSTYEYWMENQDRWATMLIVASDISEMYGLPVMPEDHIRKMGGQDALPLMWWKHPEDGRSTIGWSFTERKSSLSLDDFNMVKADDKILAMACVVGVLNNRMHLSTMELDFVLGLSRGTVSKLLAVWNNQSADFRKMIFGLSGDMRSIALRHLVLGTW